MQSSLQLKKFGEKVFSKNIEVIIANSEAYLIKLIVQLSLIEKIKKAQSDDPLLKKIMRH